MRLLPGGSQKFRSIFFQIVKDLEIQDLGLTPASLRAGGATHSFLTQAFDLGHFGPPDKLMIQTCVRQFSALDI